MVLRQSEVHGGHLGGVATPPAHPGWVVENNDFSSAKVKLILEGLKGRCLVNNKNIVWTCQNQQILHEFGIIGLILQEFVSL